MVRSSATDDDDDSAAHHLGDVSEINSDEIQTIDKQEGLQGKDVSFDDKVSSLSSKSPKKTQPKKRSKKLTRKGCRSRHQNKDAPPAPPAPQTQSKVLPNECTTAVEPEKLDDAITNLG